jgi:hypothetical protein
MTRKVLLRIRSMRRLMPATGTASSLLLNMMRDIGSNADDGARRHGDAVGCGAATCSISSWAPAPQRIAQDGKHVAQPVR